MAQSKFNWWKWGTIAVILAIVFIGGCAVGQGGFTCNRSATDTTVHTTKRDTSYVPFPIAIIPMIIKGKTIPGKPFPVQIVKWDTVDGKPVVIIEQPDDTTDIFSSMNDIAIYSDTQKVSHGFIIINDTLVQNLVAGRGLITNLSDTTIKKIIQAPKRFIGYFGLNYIGSPSDPFNMAGVDFTLKDRNDGLYSLGAFINIDGRIYYLVSVKRPIRLFPKR